MVCKMPKYLASVLLILVISSFAEEKNCEQLKQEGFSQQQLAQRGCCSWHGGVCSCNGGRVVCCDGKLSPTCGCHSEDEKSTSNSNEEDKKG